MLSRCCWYRSFVDSLPITFGGDHCNSTCDVASAVGWTWPGAAQRALVRHVATTSRPGPEGFSSLTRNSNSVSGVRSGTSNSVACGASVNMLSAFSVRMRTRTNSTFPLWGPTSRTPHRRIANRPSQRTCSASTGGGGSLCITVTFSGSPIELMTFCLVEEKSRSSNPAAEQQSDAPLDVLSRDGTMSSTLPNNSGRPESGSRGKSARATTSACTKPWFGFLLCRTRPTKGVTPKLLVVAGHENASLSFLSTE
mmetsp:Transcript_110397/g.311388  ORF Transcript_110397/g.311388 Transcript_110397/m.311388 type:complete len:253 (-) Transcript_110397:571-1329(-)